VKIADFGLAKLAGGAAEDFTLTGTHQVMGTPRYMAPEQMEGSHHVDHRADIYSLGVVFYEMLTGELPLGRFDPPSHKAHVDAKLDDVVLKTLAREPDRRYQQASEIKTEIESLRAADESVPADHVPANHVAEQRQNFTSPLGADDFEDARRQVQGPAIGLIVAGILNLVPFLLVVLGLVYQLLVGQTGVGVPGIAEIVIIAIMFGLCLPVGVVMIIGGLRMLRLESKGLATTASILALLPGPFGCMVGIPIGIWSMIVLNRPTVKAAFAGKPSNSDEPRPSPPPPRKPQAVGDQALSEDDCLRIQSMVRGPAIGLIIVGVLNLLPLVLAPVATASIDTARPNLAVATWPIFHGTALLAASTPFEEQGMAARPWWSSRYGFFWIAIVPVLMGLPLSGMLILGGWKMIRLELFWLAVIVSVIAILPCHLGFILGLPMGLWSLAVLSRPDVKLAFRLHAAGELRIPTEEF
jgi:hypothetical protein